MKPLFLNFSLAAEGSNTNRHTEETVRNLEAHLQKLESMLTDQTTDSQLTSAAYIRLSDLEEKVKLLEHRVVGAGVQMGSILFQSFEDLLVWVRVKILKVCFGLIIDGHSFLEFFTLIGHIDTETGTAAYSHS